MADNEKEKTNDKTVERAEKYYGDLPPDTENKDLFANEIDGLEEAQDKNRVQDNSNEDLATRIAEFFGGGPPGGSAHHRGHVTDPAHDKRLKQNHDDAGGNGGDSDHQDHDEHDEEAGNEDYDRAEQRRMEEHKRLLEQQQNSKELGLRQHEVNMQNAFRPTALSSIRNHHQFGAQLSRQITNKPTVASLNSARQWLKNEIATTTNDSDKKELYVLRAKIASLLIEAGALNVNG